MIFYTSFTMNQGKSGVIKESQIKSQSVFTILHDLRFNDTVLSDVTTV